MLRALSACVVTAGVALAACTTFSDLQADPEAEPGALPNQTTTRGAECTDDKDCASNKCASGKCTAPVGEPPIIDNQEQDGDETDTDCGGATAPKCENGRKCKEPTDCFSVSCVGEVCKTPTPTDGVKNQDETDADCGGTKAPKCALGKTCAKNSDCETDACSYAKKCVVLNSCTGHFGGDTCGAGETGDATAKHESCCTTVTGGAGTKIDKYTVTAGRMRAFIERFNGNLKQWAATNPPGWNPAWNENLPASMDDVANLMGPNGKRGCNIGLAGKGARTYWQAEPANGVAEDKSDFTKDQLDEKPINCVTWYMGAAICAFDGGRLVTAAEANDLITNGGANEYPWQFQNNAAYNKAAPDPRLNHLFNYATPIPAGVNVRQDPQGGPLDRTSFISAPGRFPAGNDKYGAADAVGNVMPWVNDGEKRFLFTMSWEAHDKNPAHQPWNGADGTDSYYAVGVRCAYPR